MFCLSAVYCQSAFIDPISDSESCAGPISTIPRSIEAGENRLTRGTRFVARRLDVIAVARYMWVIMCLEPGGNSNMCFSFVLFQTNTAYGVLGARMARCDGTTREFVNDGRVSSTNS